MGISAKGGIGQFCNQKIPIAGVRSYRQYTFGNVGNNICYFPTRELKNNFTDFLPHN
jgi:hypothetical protein